MTRATYPRAVTVRLLATESLETYATKALAPDAVLAGITKAAADGFYLYRHTADRPVNLQDTKAGKALCKLLNAEGFGVEWVARMVTARESSCGADLLTFDLLVNW